MTFLARELRALHQAAMFFTRIPLPPLRSWEQADLQRSIAYFPLVGWIIGGAGALAWWGAMHLWSPALASGISLVTTLLLTGAFHEDGFADVCDGFGGGSTKERVLEIMRDSRVGAFGAIGITVMLGLKWQCVAALPPLLAPATIIAAHALSRAAAVSLQLNLPYVREEVGKAKPLATGVSKTRCAVAIVLGLVPMILLPAHCAPALVAVMVARVFLHQWFRYRLGGYTGDCLGAAQQVTEVVFYLSVLALLR